MGFLLSYAQEAMTMFQLQAFFWTISQVGPLHRVKIEDRQKLEPYLLYIYVISYYTYLEEA